MFLYLPLQMTPSALDLLQTIPINSSYNIDINLLFDWSSNNIERAVFQLIVSC